jgi:hypothetical protein
MLRRTEAIIGRMAAEKARLDCTISFVSAVVVMALRSNFE